MKEHSKVHQPDTGLSLGYIFTILSGVIVLFAAVVVYLSWMFCRRKKKLLSSELSIETDESPNSLHSSNLKISQSTPDLAKQSQSKLDFFRRRGLFKTNSRQATLPTVSQRHLTFQRQLSNIEFQIQSVRQKEQPKLGKIKPELYKQSSVDSIRSEHRLCGKLYFSLNYLHDNEELKVNIISAEDLPARDFSGTSDPYVKIYLLPDRKNKCQTKVHRKTLDPEFNESFTFSALYQELQDRTLQLNVYDFDRFSRHDLIGAVVLKDILSEGSLAKETFFVRDVLSTMQEKFDLGEIMISLCYLPTAGRLTLTIIKARNLKAMDITGSSDPYAKVSLMCEGKRIKKRKTSVKKCTLSPVYNEAMVFDVPRENVDDIHMVIKVIDYDRIGCNEVMGCTALGPMFVGIARDHWFEMLENPRKPVAQWYPLQEHVPMCATSSIPVSKCKTCHSRQTTIDSSDGSTL
ncbi:synaptotagmin-9-like [Mytilus trossulus]|uniref:synaptotagmin-9-like n=1 Tax=Mytilus trossulus TaxID=6551 RepID=UPI0030071FF1